MTATRKPAPEGSRFARVRIPINKNTAAETEPCYTDSSSTSAQLARRRQAAQRMPALECGCVDPWTNCRCGDATDPSEAMVDGYRAAVELLASQGLTAAPFLPEMRALWRTGHRATVEAVASRWAVA